MKKLKDIFLDKYLKRPIFWDAIFVLFVKITWHNSNLESFKFLKEPDSLNLISNITSVCVSLAGFIIAALTIIIAFKSSIKTQNLEESENPMELILSTKYYELIIKVFKASIFELFIVTIILYIFWIASSQIFNASSYALLTICALITIVFSITRSVYVVFAILQMDKPKKQQRKAFDPPQRSFI